MKISTEAQLKKFFEGNSHIAIFGTGGMGGHIYNYLKRCGAEGQVDFFAATHKENDEFQGVTVKEVRELEGIKIPVVIATRENFHEEIKNELNNIGLDDTYTLSEEMLNQLEKIDQEDETLEEDGPSREALLEAEVINLGMQVEKLKRDYNGLLSNYDGLLSILPSLVSEKTLDYALQQESDPGKWFRLLKYAAQRYLVVLTVKDTSGSNMSAEIYRNILGAGFRKFRKDLWYTYIGVMNKGRLIGQEFHNVKPSYYYNNLMGEKFKFSATSKSFNEGNCGDIIIDGKNYSANVRGVNVVIYDPEEHRLIDSVGFDSHNAGIVIFNHAVV